jgi:hypothetical protein
MLLERRTGRRVYVLPMDAPMESLKEECALDMGLRPNDAAKKDVHAKLKLGEYALRMEQRGRCVRLKDVQMESSTEECALGTGQRSNFAARKDAPTNRSKVAYAQGMVQKKLNGAELKTVRNRKACSREGCTRNTQKG